MEKGDERETKNRKILLPTDSFCQQHSYFRGDGVLHMFCICGEGPGADVGRMCPL